MSAGAEMCDGRVEVGEGSVRECRLPLGHLGDCEDERGSLGQPSEIWKENSASEHRRRRPCFVCRRRWDEHGEDQMVTCREIFADWVHP